MKLGSKIDFLAILSLRWLLSHLHFGSEDPKWRYVELLQNSLISVESLETGFNYFYYQWGRSLRGVPAEH